MVLVPLTALDRSTRSPLLVVAAQHYVQPTGGIGSVRMRSRRPPAADVSRSTDIET